MVTNFDYLKKDQKFSKFADVAISAEKVILLDPEACIINCRRAMEFAVKWVYSMDNLEMPYRDNLHSLLEADDFRQTVGSDLWRRLDYIRKTGNSIAHNSKKKGRDEAMLCLENLFIFMDYIAYCYADEYEDRNFDEGIILARINKAKESKQAAKDAKEELEKIQKKDRTTGTGSCKVNRGKCIIKKRIIGTTKRAATDVCSKAA